MKKTVLSIAILVGALQFASADVKLPAIISDRMVVQQDVLIPIWGWADPGEQVTVELGGQVKPPWRMPRANGW